MLDILALMSSRKRMWLKGISENSLFSQVICFNIVILNGAKKFVFDLLGVKIFIVACGSSIMTNSMIGKCLFLEMSLINYPLITRNLLSI